MARKKHLSATKSVSEKKKGLRPKQKKRVSSNATQPKSGAAPDFPIIGLGASAGGLEALEKLISSVPAESGMAFIAVTHQHRNHVSLLPELLQKQTDMSVRTAENGLRVEPNCLYLSPADGYLDLLAGRLQIENSPLPESLHLPIDHFFKSLADDRKEKAIGIVLSGTGSDGTLGLQAIRSASGTTFAQEPETAKFPGMPSSAVDKGLVDHTLSPEQIPQKLLKMTGTNSVSLVDHPEMNEDGLSDSMQKIILCLRSRIGNDFTAYKPSTIRRRIERRVAVHQLRGPSQYLQMLRENPQEMEILFRELLISVTQFFRDAEAFDELANSVLPDLMASRPEGSTLRVWVPACATGQEAYTLAIAFRETAERLKLNFKIQIFGTDLDSQAIDVARAGFYPLNIAREVNASRLISYFVKEPRGYRLKKELRETVIFAVHNVLKDPPFTNLDMVACRNLLIYFKPEGQRRTLDFFGYALHPGGVLFLGSSENVSSHSSQFKVVSKKWKIFTRKEMRRILPPVTPTTSRSVVPAARHDLKSGSPERGPTASLASVVEKMLLQNFAPASVIVSERGEIAYIHGRVGDYLEVAGGQPRLNILEMARDGLRVPLAAALRRASKKKEKVVEEGLRVKTDGHFVHIRMTVTRFSSPEPLRGLLLVTFLTNDERKLKLDRPSDRRSGKTSKDLVSALERELRYTKDTLQGTVEQLESSNEELQSTNEEMQSTNEELQSVNEELETSKEEMQSLNEELQTVNAQLQAKVEDLGTANDDMQNLLNSTEIATVFLDREFRIKRFTAEATNLFNLIPSDVGRPIGDLASNLDYKELQTDAAEIIQKLGFKEREVKLTSGEWRQVRIFPYRTTENVIEGLVLTFTDINRIKLAEEEVRRGRAYAESIVETIRQPLVVLDENLRIVSVNRNFCRTFNVSARDIQGHTIYQAANGLWSIPALRRLLENVLPKNTTIEGFEIRHTFDRVGPKHFIMNARRLDRENHAPAMILLAMEDISPGVTAHVPPKTRKKSQRSSRSSR